MLPKGEQPLETGGRNRDAGLHLLVLLVACVLAHLPAVRNSHVLLTGDEAVLGVMARDLLAGRHVSLFMVGQHYGLSFIEAAFGAVSFSLLGVGTVALRWAMLALFLVGVAWHFAALARLTSARLAYLAVLMFTLVPPWRIWSIQARGGYLTAFAAAGLAVLLATGLRRDTRLLVWGALGGLLATIYLAQALWLAGLLPILAVAIVRARPGLRAVFTLVATAVLGAVVLAAMGSRMTHHYWGGSIFSLAEWPASIAMIPSRVVEHLGSNLFGLTEPNGRDPAVLDRVAGLTWCAGIVVGLGLQLVRIAQRRWLPWSHAFCLSAMGTLAYTTVISYSPRYLLPLSGYVMLWLAVEMHDLLRRTRLALPCGMAVCAVALACGTLGILREQAPALVTWGVRDQSADDAFRDFLSHLRAEGIGHAYTETDLLQWQALFYGGGQVAVRARDVAGRDPVVAASVDAALDGGAPTAIIGQGQEHVLNLLRAQRPDAVVSVYPDVPEWWVYRNPDRALLESLGFALHAPARPGP